MKKLFVFIVLTLFLASMIGFTLADEDEGNQINPTSNEKIKERGEIKYLELEGGCWIIETNDGTRYSPINLDEEYKQEEAKVGFTATIATDIVSACQIGILIELQEIDFIAKNDNLNKKVKLQERNRLRLNQSELPEGCTTSGSVLKCNVDGGRVMAIFAGNSGNTILQVKGINASTKVELYKENGSFYGVSEDNETILINYFPDEVRERIRNRIHADVEFEDEIELDKEGLYRVKTKKKARLFYLVPVREKVRAQVDPETGEIIKIRNPWWGFLAKDLAGEEVLGESCGTVNPDNVDECCQNKGYDMWDVEAFECVLNEE